MIDGSPDNNIFNLIFGYNGLGRIFGSSGPGGGGGGGGTGFSGATGPLRLFDELMGAQASWLLPAALLALVVGLWHSRRAPRTDRTRAALLLWGGWLLVTAAIFSFGQGVIHTYYTVALVPAIAALIAITGSVLWRVRETAGARITAAIAVAITTAWSYVLLDRTPHWEAWLRPLIVVSAALAVIGLLAAPALRRLWRRAPVAVAVFALVACLAGPAAYSAQTITTAHTGSIPSAGPGSSSMGGGMGPGGGTGPGGRASGHRLGLPGAQGGGGAPSGSSGSSSGSTEAGGVQLFGSSGAKRSGGSSTSAGGFPSAGGTPSAGGGGGAGGQSTVSSALMKALETDASRFRWVAAVSGSQSAASLELGSGGEPVMAIGGFNNQGGNLTLAQFKAYVAKSEIHYYIVSGSGGGAGPGGGSGASSSSAIATWVKANFKSVEVGGQTVYDLTQASS